MFDKAPGKYQLYIYIYQYVLHTHVYQYPPCAIYAGISRTCTSVHLLISMAVNDDDLRSVVN